MGFSLELLLLYPRRIGETSFRIWDARETISFGRVTRLEKLTGPSFGRLHRNAHERAGICAASTILGKLFNDFGLTPRACVAPRILLADDWEERAAASAFPVSDLIDIDQPPENVRFQSHMLEEHRRALALEDSAFDALLAQHVPMLNGPVLWTDCAGIATTLDNAVAERSAEWFEASRDPVSLALFTAWRAYLRTVGEVGARALFVFPY